MSASPSDLKLRYPQLRGLADEAVAVRALDFGHALRVRYGLPDTEDASFHVERVVLMYFPWWMQHSDAVRSDGVSTGGANVQYGELPWPAAISQILEPLATRRPAPGVSRSVPARFVW